MKSNQEDQIQPTIVDETVASLLRTVLTIFN